MIVFSWLLIIAGILLPVLMFIFKSRHVVINFVFLFSPLINIILVAIGVVNNSYLIYENEKIGKLLFIICISEVSLTVIYLIYYACLKGIAFISSENDWSNRGPKFELVLLILMIIGLLLLPNIAFAMLYNFWGILFIKGYELFLGDYIYYAFSIIYSLPIFGDSAKFQEYVGLNDLLRVVQMIHVLISKIIEFIVIGFIIGKVASLIQEKLLTRN